MRELPLLAMGALSCQRASTTRASLPLLRASHARAMHATQHPATNLHTLLHRRKPHTVRAAAADDADADDENREHFEPQTNWAEELTAVEPETELSPRTAASSAADADELTVVDIDDEGVDDFIDGLAALAAAADSSRDVEAEAEEDLTIIREFVDRVVLADPALAEDQPAASPLPLPAAAAPFAEAALEAARLTPTYFVGSWPIGDPLANPTVGGRQGLRRVEWMRGIRDDLKRRQPLYASDWRDGVEPKMLPKTLAVISLMWFACLAPVLAFGGAMSVLTEGAMGVPEVILSRGVCGMLHACIAGQPMTFIGPTGLTLAFTTALYSYCKPLGVPFLPMYAWVGLWTSAMLLVAAAANLSGLIRYCTRFTEDVFNALLSFNYLSEAVRSIKAAFAVAGATGSGFLALNTAVLTAWLCQITTAFRTKRYLSPIAREAISDFGPPFVILSVTAFSITGFVARLGTLLRLPVSASGAAGLGGGRALFVDLLALPLHLRWLAALPAVFLATLFFLDQNITVRTVNSPSNKLRKGAAYHLDLAALAVVTGLASVAGLPWMCSATVESLNHIRAMSVYSRKKAVGGGPPTEVVEKVVETRATGFGVHAAVLASVLFLPLISVVPLAVVSGVFLYLGRKVVMGNLFVERCKKLWVEGKELDESGSCPAETQMLALGRWAVFRFTLFQGMCLAGLLCLRQNPSTALVFPSVIGVLMVIRALLLPRVFSRRELRLLDTPIGSDSKEL